MTTVILFSHQNDTSTYAHSLCLLENLVLVILVILESKGMEVAYNRGHNFLKHATPPLSILILIAFLTV